jgi:transcriptional regulator with XRE-family HTH domain
MMEWGAARILALRKHAGMTQARFAQWLGVSIKQVKYLEHQRRNPSGPSRRLLDILAGQFHFSGTEEVVVLGAGATHLKPPSDNPKPQTVPAQPRDAAKPPANPPAPDVEHKAPAEEKDAMAAASPEVPDDDAFVWR